MALYFRRDDDVQNGLGEAVPNLSVTYYVQPALTLAAIYYDSAGLDPAPNPQYTNGLGQTAAYMAAGLYTIVYAGAQIQTLTYPDQLVGGSAEGVAIAPVVPTPAPDGVIRIFTLPFVPPTPDADQLFVSGSYVAYGVAYTVSGSTITWIGAVPPQTGDLLEYFTR